MILGADGSRLSKRHGAVSVMQFRDEGYLPEALLNYLVRLGWSHGDQEVFSVTEMITYFDLSAVNGSASIFNMDKLLWLNQQYIMNLEPEKVAYHLQWHMAQLGLEVGNGPSLVELVKVQRERAKTLVEMAAISSYFYKDVEAYDDKAVKKNFTADAGNILQQLHDVFAAIVTWEAKVIHDAIVEMAEALSVNMGKLAQPLRVAITGAAVSPAIDLTLALLGKEKTLVRIQNAVMFISNAKNL